jgi:predicted  nucleic acid-binding Zn-ribbon protein
MSDTPRTDALRRLAGAFDQTGIVGMAAHAEELERELTAAKAEVEKADADLVAYRAEANALEEVVRRLNDEHRAEVERLRDALSDLVALLPDPELDRDDVQRGYVLAAKAALKEPK